MEVCCWYYKAGYRPCVLTCACNLSTKEVEAGGSGFKVTLSESLSQKNKRKQATATQFDGCKLAKPAQEQATKIDHHMKNNLRTITYSWRKNHS